MMPSYNCARTLPMALASLQAQTHEEWECLLVDDGSTDETQSLLSHVTDPRIKYTRLKKNSGRGIASQTALNAARGEWITTLDADDWMYPDKLAVQVEVLSQNRKLCLLSTAVSLITDRNEITHVQSPNSKEGLEIHGPGSSLRISFSHPASMMRTAILKLFPYDQRLRRVQDADFLLRMLNGRYYGTLSSSHYAYLHGYNEQGMNGYFESAPYARQVYRKHLTRVPIQASKAIAGMYAKELVYRVAHQLDLGERLFSRRYRLPTDVERERYASAYEKVTSELEKMGI